MCTLLYIHCSEAASWRCHEAHKASCSKLTKYSGRVFFYCEPPHKSCCTVHAGDTPSTSCSAARDGIPEPIIASFKLCSVPYCTLYVLYNHKLPSTSLLLVAVRPHKVQYCAAWCRLVSLNDKHRYNSVVETTIPPHC